MLMLCWWKLRCKISVALGTTELDECGLILHSRDPIVRLILTWNGERRNATMVDENVSDAIEFLPVGSNTHHLNMY